MVLPPELMTQILLRDHFCLALPPDHALATQDQDPSPDQLAGEPLVVPEQLAGTNEVAHRGDFAPHIVARPGRMSAVLTEVSLGTGLAIVPSSVCDALRLPHLSFRELAGPSIPSEVAALFRSEATPIGRLFIQQFATVSPGNSSHREDA